MLDGITNQLFQWIANNGIAVVFAVLLLGMIYRVLFSGMAALRDSITQIGENHTMATTKLADAVNILNTTAAQNNESLKIVLMFISQNMQQVIAHREAVEGSDAASHVPGPLLTSAETMKANVGVQNTENPTKPIQSTEHNT